MKTVTPKNVNTKSQKGPESNKRRIGYACNTVKPLLGNAKIEACIFISKLMTNLKEYNWHEINKLSTQFHKTENIKTVSLRVHIEVSTNRNKYFKHKCKSKQIN